MTDETSDQNLIKSNKVKQFPIFNIHNIPEALRKVANDIEANPSICTKIVLAGLNEDGSVWYKAFGKSILRYEAVGILEYAKREITES